MELLKKCCQCYFCGQTACQTAQCIDMWWGIEAQGLSYVYCNACCWSLCAPLCFDCKLGDTGKAVANCTKGIKYCLFSCALCCVAPCDGCYNCLKVMQMACGEGGVRRYKDITQNTAFLGNKVKLALSLETGNEPIKSMDSYEP